jgi:uncharacterized repeat protein (TIGR01451 family)
LSIVEVLPSLNQSSAPDLSITKSHPGNFSQGQTGATYAITATNSGGAATSGTVTVVDTLPAGLTATQMSGMNWNCTVATLTCTRNDALAAGTSYPPITLTVTVASNAPASVTNTATVSGGGETNTSNDTATDVTTINASSAAPDLTIAKSHSGNFSQGQTGAMYSINVTNSGGTPTSGTVTMADTLPAGLTPTAISGTGWTCTLATLTCTRSDALAAAASYPPITLTVNVASDAPSSITNTATISGGGQSNTGNDSANDITTITAPTWRISGTISPASCGSSATVTVSGAASFNTIADASGNYSLTQLPNGTYTVTPTKNGCSFTPSNQPVTINGANASGINFTAAALPNLISLDANTSKDGATASASIVSPAFSTSSSNELLLALIATDYLGGANTTVTGVSGGGLTWAPVVRANAQSGDSEIWRAFAPAPLNNVSVAATLSQSVVSSITVMSFSGVNTSGTNGSGAIGAALGKSAASGAPSATPVTTGNNSWILGVGNDFDNAIARTVGAGQTLVHQYLTPTGDTYWVQRQTDPVPASGTSVTINDTAPTADRFNLSVVEILANSGSVTDTTPPTVSITSPAQGTTIAGRSTVSVRASDDTSVAGVQFLLDGAPLGGELTTTPYSTTWDTTAGAGGSHALAARVRDSAGNTTTSTPVSVTVDNSGNPAVVGSWSSVVNLPAVAVDLILLQNNKVLFYQDGATPTVWDYVLNTFTNVPTPVNLFCSGHALLADGRILVVGGYGGSGSSIGIANAEIFDPIRGTWTPVPNMAYKRWYPTATTLSDGRILVTAGWQTSAHTNAGVSEIYDPVANKWTQLTNANNPFETYPFLYLLHDGRVIHIGGSEYPTDTDILDLNTQTWSVVDPNIVDGGSATMYAPGKFMKAGSATDSQGVGPSSNTTFVLDMSQSSPAWRQTPSMAYPRSFLNLTTLPDGSVLATGGETDKDGGVVSNAVYAAELWSPQTQNWSTMASMRTPREYHGTALLLPNGRVLVSGMGADFGSVPDQRSAEFYSPPYLFKGPRPTINQVPTQIQYGSTFFVGTPDGASISNVALIRTGAVTHFFDQNERYVPLSFAQTSGGLSVTAPATANLAPPGYYMLFIVNNSGVPSIAPFVQVP